MARNGEERGGAWLKEGKPQSANHGIEKTPQFRSSLERFAERAAEKLGATFGALFSAHMEKTRPHKTFAALGEHVNLPAVLLTSPALGHQMAMLCEGGLVDLMIAAMFGVEPANDEEKATPTRKPSALEMRIVRQVVDMLAQCLCAAFAPVGAFDLDVEKIETLDDDTLLGAKDYSALIAPLTIKAPGGAFGVALLLPHPFLTALAASIARGPAPGAADLDPIWSSRMEKRVAESSLTLTAVLDQFEMSLSDVSTLKVGHILPLSEEGGMGRVRIESGERGVFVCSLGERSGRYALEIEDIIAKTNEAAYPGGPAST
jgi:flagellar motor switch protein FliM